MSWKRQLRHRCEYYLFRLITCIIQAVSVRQSVWIAKRLAYVMANLLPRKFSRYQVARENLRTAFGENLSDADTHKIIQGMWTHLFRMVFEIVQLPRRMRLENSRQTIVFRDRKPLVQALATGRPVITLSGHFGNWEVAMATFGIFGYRTGVVARAIDNPWLHKWFNNFREATGHKTVLKRGGYDEIVELMDRKGYLGLACDQDAGSKGMFVDFFGKPASTFKSIALLAMQYDAIIAVTYAQRLEDNFTNAPWVQYEVGCEELIDPRNYQSANAVQEITQQYTSALERIVQKDPTQYFWVHKRWKSEPRKRKKSQQKKAA